MGCSLPISWAKGLKFTFVDTNFGNFFKLFLTSHKPFFVIFQTYSDDFNFKALHFRVES